MPTYKLRKNRVYFDESGNRLKAGDTVEMTKERFQAGNFGTHFKPVSGDDDVDRDSGDRGATGTSGTLRGGSGLEKESLSTDSNSSAVDTDSKFSAITGMSVDEVKSLIESIETEEDLELIRKEELANKKRKGVIDAINAALEE